MKSDDRDWRELHERCIEQMLDDPDLSEDEKRELLRQIDLSDEEGEPVELPEGAEPLSKTIIEMRQGTKPGE